MMFFSGKARIATLAINCGDNGLELENEAMFTAKNALSKFEKK